MTEPMTNAAVPFFQMSGISKRYGGVRALENAELFVRPGRVHAILGENGAGKSTLIKIMTGVVAPDEGRMLIDGAEVSLRSPADAAPSASRSMPATTRRDFSRSAAMSACSATP